MLACGGTVARLNAVHSESLGHPDSLCSRIARSEATVRDLVNRHALVGRLDDIRDWPTRPPSELRRAYPEDGMLSMWIINAILEANLMCIVRCRIRGEWDLDDKRRFASTVVMLAAGV